LWQMKTRFQIVKHDVNDNTIWLLYICQMSFMKSQIYLKGHLYITNNCL
jgi:hypothetical protein